MGKIYNLSDYFFHGVGGQVDNLCSDQLNICLINLESIITCGYIMNRETIIKNNINVNLITEKDANFNGQDRVSVCFNPNDAVLYDNIKMKYNCCTCDSAYDMFIKNSIACMFDKTIFNEENTPDNLDNRQQDELQIIGNIPFNKTRAIILNDKNNNYDTYKKLKKLLIDNNIKLPILKTFNYNDYKLYGEEITPKTFIKN